MVPIQNRPWWLLLRAIRRYALMSSLVDLNVHTEETIAIGLEEQSNFGDILEVSLALYYRDEY